MFRTSNPMMRGEAFAQATGSGVMTFSGTLLKTGVLLLLLLAGATVGWASLSLPVVLVGAIGGFALAIATSFKPQWSPITAPLYALCEGLAVGAVSAVVSIQMARTQYAGAVPLAVLGTFAVLGVMLLLYATRIVRVTQTFLTVVLCATLAIGVTYLVTVVGGMFWPALWRLPMYQSGPVGIGFSVFVIVVAALNLAVDFKLIEDGVRARAPKFMEWYGGFALLVTLVWLYLEILRLLSKLADRR